MRPTSFLMKGWARAPQDPDPSKVPFRCQMPLTLKPRISSKGSKLKERGCLFEISLVLSCLEKNNYENKLCVKEVETFQQCYKSYLTNKHTSKEHARKGILTPDTKNLKYNQINLLLKKYPQV